MKSEAQKDQVYNITDYISDLAEKHPEQAAILHPVRVNYGDFQKSIDQAVLGMRKLGIKEKSRAVILIKPGPQMFILVFSLMRIGAIPVLIDPGMGAKNMAKALKKIKIDTFIGIPKAHLLRVFFSGSFKSTRYFISTRRLFLLKAVSISSIQNVTWKKSTAFHAKEEDESAILFTSGSTGPAKAVLYSNSTFYAQIDILKKRFGYGKRETDCCTFPLTSLLAMCLGHSIVFSDMNMTKPASLNPEMLVKNIQEHKCTHLFCSPMVLKKLASYGKNKQIKLHTLKKVITAGAIVPPELLKDFGSLLEKDSEIHTPYGATEALPISDITARELLTIYKDSDENIEGICVGYALPEIELKIIAINDEEIKSIDKIRELDSNQVGEILVKGPVVSQKYLGQNVTNSAKIWDESNKVFWHRMGDLGRKDLKNRIWFYGRKTHRVSTKIGELYTIPTEALYNSHPLINRTALVGIQEKSDFTETPVICVQLEKGLKRTNKKELRAELSRISKNNKLDIDRFFFFEEFPVDPRHNAKIFREKLKKWVRK